MGQPNSASRGTWAGVPRTPRALAKFLATALLAGMAGALLAAIAADALGLSALIAALVSGPLAAVFIALLIARHGPAA